MPWILLLAGAAWYFFGQNKASATRMPPALPSAPKKALPKKGAIRVTIGPAVLTSKEVRALPLGVRTPYQDLLLIKSAAKQAGVKLPDKVAAKRQAQSIADEVRTKGKAYDVHKVQAWQILADVKTQNGSYDVPTSAALRSMGASQVPTQSYTRSGSAPFAVK